MGKTTWALNIASNNIKQNKTVLIFSLEMTNSQLLKKLISAEAEIPMDYLMKGTLTSAHMQSFKKARDLFFDSHLYLYDKSPITIETLINKTKAIQAVKDIDLIVIDSVAALTPKAEIEGDMGDSKVGLHARLMSQALRKLTGTIAKTHCTCIFINQLREKIGVMFGNPETTTGGNALKFYASVRLDIRRSTQIKDGENVIGNRTKVKIVKNKVAPPFRVAEFDILYGEGVSKMGEIIDLGTQYEVIQKSGSWFSYDGTKLGQGREGVKGVLRDNPELADEIEQKIIGTLQNG